MINFFKKVRENINTFLYDSQKGVIATLQIVILIASAAAIGILIYYHGFSISEKSKELLFEIIKGIFGIFIINYLIRLFYSFEKLEFIKKTWFEGILILLLLLDISSLYLFNFPIIEAIFRKIGIENFYSFYIIFVQIYILALIITESSNISTSFLKIKIKPAALFILSFMVIIVAGSFLLLLPEMIVKGKTLSLLDAFFTAVSATCVTGLIVVDTATHFTFKGHLIIFMLMQLGGIGIVSFATFFASFLKRGVGIRHQAAVQEFLNESSLYNTLQLLKEIIFYTFAFELTGAIVIFALLDPAIPFAGLGDKIFFALFHSISAFCNAGFSLFTEGLYHAYLQHAYLLHIAFAVLIIFGGLGFPVLKDLFSIKNLRLRLKQPWRSWKTSTQIAIYASIFLIIGGTIVFFALEYNNSLKNANPVEAVIISLFQSITARTAGFNTIDFSSLTTPTYILILYLMFIGASSGSTGGGIKTSTFVVIMLSVISTIKGKRQIEFGRKSISNELLYRAFSIFVFALLFILIATFLLTLTDPDKNIMHLVFEEVSAFCTVGLSTGITASLSDLGKIIITTSMFVGRVGTLSLAFALSSPSENIAYKYPSTNILVG